METYRRIKQQIAELEKKAADLRRAEAAKVIADIKKKIAKFELQPDDLFGTRAMADAVPVKARRGRPAATVKAAAKYQDPASGKTWTGRGKPPDWIKGKDREAFLIGAPPKAKAAPTTKAAPAAKKTAAPKAAAAKTVKKVTAKPTTKKPAVKKPTAKKPTAPKVTVPAVAEAMADVLVEVVADAESTAS